MEKTHAASSSLSPPAPTSVAQRKCACGKVTPGGAECEECRKKRQPLQRRAAHPSSPVAVPPIVHDVLSSPGRPLDAGTRGFMESRFGRDFSHVRVHDDARAAASARAVDAHAYTVGENIFFATDRYDPQSAPGRRLLAHELAHTVQQHGLQRSTTGVSMPSSAEDRRLEHEADALAAAAVRGGEPEPARVAGSDHLVVSRAKARPAEEDLKPLRTPADADTLDHAVLEVGEDFPLPEEKGPVKKVWDAIAKGSGLRASLDLRKDPKVDIKQDRPELRDTWLAKVGWPKEEKDQRWSDLLVSVLKKKPAKGKDLVDEFPRVDGKACHMDHIVELQVFGGNEKENIQVLDPGPNMKSGGLIRGYLTDQGERAKARVKEQAARAGTKPPAGVLLVWRKVKQGDPICGDCCQIEQEAVKGSGAKKGATVAAKTGTTSEGLDVTPKSVTFLGKKSEILIPKNVKKPTIPLRGSEEIVENRAVSRLIPGLLLEEYTIKNPAISATFDPEGVRLPLSLKEKAGKQGQIHVAVGKDGELSVHPGKTHVPIHYLPLSEGFIENVKQDSGGLAGTGKIIPSIPLLKGAQLGIEFSADHLAVTTEVPKEKLKSLPGMRVTEASLKFELAPAFKPAGTIGFEVGPRNKPVAKGSIEASADAQGFVATGHVDARIPGMDEATGDVTYRRETGWAGTIQLKTSKSFLENASVVVGFSDNGLVVSGAVGVKLPGDQKIMLQVQQKRDTWVYIGDGEFKVPGGKVDPVVVHFTYDGERLDGHGETGFTFKDLKGRIHINYRDGKVSGEGTLDVHKGRAAGKIHVKMSPAQKFSGDGEITYRVTDNLIATAGIKVDEDEKVTLKGALEFPKPIELFKPFKGDYEIFSVGISIPIPGASIGAVGVKARIEGGLNAGYHIGPGELRNTKIAATLNPLEDKPDLDVAMTAQLYISAGAYISGHISGGIMLDIGIASATGGLTVTATAMLDGHVASQVELHYMKGRFDVKADFELMLALALKLALDAFVKAEAGIGPFKVATRKDWNLASYTYDTGLQLGMRTKTPLYYASDQPFKPPSLDQIEIIKPQLDAAKMLEAIFHGAGNGTETKE
jgi:uncharacterized protein DUF4157